MEARRPDPWLRPPPGLLDTYETERRPVAQRVVMHTQAQGALIGPGAEVTALRELFTELLQDKEPVQRIADLMAGADIRYDMGTADAHPSTGRWAPDLDTESGTVRLAELTTTGRPLLLDLTEDASLTEEASGWKDRVDHIAARPHDAATPATALLLRPDCYIAWACASRHPDAPERETLRAALSHWFGAAG